MAREGPLPVAQPRCSGDSLRAMSTDRGWCYVIEPEPQRVPADKRLSTPSGRCLSVRHHGAPGRIDVVDQTRRLPPAALLRVAKCVGEATNAGELTPVKIVEKPYADWIQGVLELPASIVTSGHWETEAAVREAFAGHHRLQIEAQSDQRTDDPAPERRPRVLFFESLMNAEMPHNDAELSQGVLHMVSALGGHADVVLANVKMAIVGTERPALGLDSLAAALAGGPVDLVCITLLEGYWDGVVSLIRELRELGCKAHIAVGGVMPTLTPEHVAAHLADVSFVCRGAGEVFLPTLAAVAAAWPLGTPIPAKHRDALFALTGLIVLDPGGHRVLSCNSAEAPSVASLDRVPLDLGYLAPRHIASGIELSTSRGCAHRCTFCSIIGRESYQARSAGSVIDLLGQYDAHYAAIFGDGPRDHRGRLTTAPSNGYRVHISDDDFACDRDRALAFFRALPSTPFRLASCQVSIADLCVRHQGQLLAQPDHELLDAMNPACFDDAGRKFPIRDFVADHRTRKWSSYLQIGVESFSDTELSRLGKGYALVHLRRIVGELSARHMHHDAYFILSNAETTVDDLVEVLDEVVRLKLAHPLFFHIRFPVVSRLVSYFPSASYRRRLRHDKSAASRLRSFAQSPGYPEFDYPFVEQDDPDDPVVAAAVDKAFFTDENYYAASYERLRESAVSQYRSTPTPNAEFAARLLDDRARRRVFEMLSRARRRTREADPDPAEELRLRAVAEEQFGPIATWLPAFQRFDQGGITRLVVIPTWQCELRCNYCYIPKQDGRVMSEATLDRSIGLLLSSERPALTLQFFGGEALMEWGLVKHAIEHGMVEAKRRGKTLDFILSSNGWSLDDEKLAWLAQRPVKLELSLDGDPQTQRAFRPSRHASEDSYENGIAPRAAAIVASGMPHDVIMVVHPSQIHKLAANYLHIASLGFPRIQINFALGKVWSLDQRRTLAAQLFELAGELRRRPEVCLVNAENEPMPIRLNGEPTVDFDGTVYGGNAFLHETEHKAKFRLGHLDDLYNFDRYWMDAPPNTELVKYGYPPEITANNLKVGAVMSDFLRWYRAQRLPPSSDETRAPNGH